MNPIEAAVAEMNRQPPWKMFQQEDGPRVLLAFFRAAFGCPQCGGQEWPDGPDDCSAEHVEITVFGVTIWADPAKCEWRCEANEGMRSRLSSYELCLGRSDWERTARGVPIGHDPKKFRCGWHPKWETT